MRSDRSDVSIRTMLKSMNCQGHAAKRQRRCESPRGDSSSTPATRRFPLDRVRLMAG